MPWQKAIDPAAYMSLAALLIGGGLYGAGFVKEQFESTLVYLLIGAALALATRPVVFVWHYLRAPAAIWRQDQDQIQTLKAHLEPRISLEFSPGDCFVQMTPAGNPTYTPFGGLRQISVGLLFYVLRVRCRNMSDSEEVASARGRLENVEREERGQFVPTAFVDHVQLTWATGQRSGDDDEQLDLPPGGTDYLRVLVLEGVTDGTPVIAAKAGALWPHYHTIFGASGLYRLRIRVHGKNAGKAQTITLDVRWDRASQQLTAEKVWS